MLLIFVLDNSASMNQRTVNGLSLFDCAKSAIEHFHKVRQRDASFRMDRYMLVTCDENSETSKVPDRFPFSNFFRVLKSTRTKSVNDLSSTIQKCFEYIHLQRLAMDVDKFGMGRNPYSIDPTLFFVFSDGGNFISKEGSFHSFSFNPSPSIIGAELSSQINRWDQKVFVCLLKIPSSIGDGSEKPYDFDLQKNQYLSAQSNSNADMAISSFCESTGGKCAIITSWKMMVQHIEFLAARISPSVIVSFDQIPLPGLNPVPPNILASMHRKCMFVKFGVSQGQFQGQAHWPLPENYWPMVDSSQRYLPFRDSHPLISYKPVDTNPYIPQHFVHDIYEIEPNPILNFLLKSPTESCWQVYIKHSKGVQNGYGDPFGYLKLNNDRTGLLLYVLPYNYPILFKLIDQIYNQGLRMNPDGMWRQNFERYCFSVPPYYAPSLRAALKKFFAFSVVPDNMDSFLASGYLSSTLKKIRGLAKVEVDRETSEFMTDQNQTSSSHSSLDLPKQTSLYSLLFPVPSSTLDQLPSIIQSNVEEEAKKKESLDESFMSPADHLSVPSLSTAESFQSQKRIFNQCLFTSPTPFSHHLPPAKNTTVNKSSLDHNITHSHNSTTLPSLMSPEGTKKENLTLNPFDVKRENMFNELDKAHFHVISLLNEKRKTKIQKKKNSKISSFISQFVMQQEEQEKHYLPIEKMGDFNESLLKQQIPRNPYLDDNERNKQFKLMFGNPYKQDKSSNENANETWSEGQLGGQNYWKRKKQKRMKVLPPALSKEEKMESNANVKAVDASSPSFSSLGSDSREKEETETKDGLSSYMKHFDIAYVSQDVNTNERKREKYASEEKKDEKVKFEEEIEVKVKDYWTGTRIKKEENLEDKLMPRDDKFKHYITTPQGTKIDQNQAVNFLLSILKVLRNVKGGNSEKLFQLLAMPDFPVNKSNFVRQLVVQAQNYRKFSLANELSEYLLKIKS